MPAAGAGRPFVKMSGSGNDFVFLDARAATGADPLERPDWIRAACARGTGIGADGVVFLVRPEAAGAAAAIRYYNSDGSRASLCGNATLCATRLAVARAIAPADGFSLETDSGPLAVRLRDGRPEIDLARVTDVRPTLPIPVGPGELRIGFAVAGVPHVVVLVDDVDAVDVFARGSALRRDPAVGAAGANVNFVAPAGDRWRIRTFERGVEGETLACGTGATATGIVLASWGLVPADGTVDLETRSGRTLGVRPGARGDGTWAPSLAGEGRIVFEGALAEL